MYLYFWFLGAILSLKQLGIFFFQNWTLLFNVGAIDVMIIYETDQMQCIFGQHCGYWWSAALAFNCYKCNSLL